MSLPRFGYSGRTHANPVPAAPPLKVTALEVCYPGTQTPALHDATLTVHEGRCVALVGHNGAGKSTLLKAAAGLLIPSSGEIRIYGNSVGACHHRVAFLEQRSDLDWRFPITVERMVLTGRFVHLGWFAGPKKIDRDIAAEQIERLGLSSLAQRQICDLSGGQQQRVLLARALAQESDLLLFDEPLTSLDAENQEVIYSVLNEMRNDGKTLVMATHDTSSDFIFDDVIRLDHGKVQSIQQNTPARVISGGSRAHTSCVC